MGYWGWRTLVMSIMISVWVAGCTIAHENAPTSSPTLIPPVTLTLRQHGPQSTSSPTVPPPPTTTAPQVADAGFAVYTVRPGDTLLGIALEFGLDLALLRDANPDLNPHGLQVGQSVRIPGPDTRPPLSPTPAIHVHLYPPHCHEIPTGRTLCLGEVQNRETLPLERLRVRLVLFDAAGQHLAQAEASVMQAVIPPGQPAPYSVIFDTEWDESYSVQAALLAGHRAQGRYAALRVDDTQLIAGSGYYTFQAAITNTSASATGPVRLVLRLYDPQGQLVGYRVDSSAAGLAAGEQRPVSMAVPFWHAMPAVTPQLYAEARLIDQ